LEQVVEPSFSSSQTGGPGGAARASTVLNEAPEKTVTTKQRKVNNKILYIF
jgi:hypothetical protein